jgi:hypothetical protein
MAETNAQLKIPSRKIIHTIAPIRTAWRFSKEN